MNRFRYAPEILKELRIRLGDARGVLNNDAGDLEPCERKAHCHAMVVVSSDLRGLERVGAREDGQPVGSLFDVGAELLELGCKRGESIGFFNAHIGDVANRSGGLGEERDDGESLRDVAAGVHIDVDSAQRG